MATLVVVDHDHAAVSEATLRTVTAAQQLPEGDAVTLLVAGGAGVGDVAASAAAIPGVAKVLVVEDAALAHATAEPLCSLIADVTKAHAFSHVLAPATSVGRDVLPRVGALLDVQPIADVIAVVDADTFTRPMYAGNVIQTVKSSDAVKLVTIRTTAFDAAAADGGAGAAVETQTLTATPPPGAASEWVKDELSKSDRPALTSARVVVSGGRGLKSGDNFALLDSLAGESETLPRVIRLRMRRNFNAHPHAHTRTRELLSLIKLHASFFLTF
jgi:electron transfer flavoprotein alpha subunit